MKKFLIFFVCLICTIQTSIAFDYDSDGYVFSYVFFPLQSWEKDSYSFRIECNREGNYWLRYSPHRSINWTNNRSILKGKHLYLKLSNAEIIELECKDVTVRLVDYYVGLTDIYELYANYCYFDLSEDQIKKLKEYEIIKIRGEMKEGTTDIELTGSKKLTNEFNYISKRLEEKLKEEKQQNELNANPLKDF